MAKQAVCSGPTKTTMCRIPLLATAIDLAGARHKLPQLLSEYEKYIHVDDPLPKLVRAGFLHVQFETIHPYLDGNGRIGGLLIALLLEHWGLLKAPLLYLSLFFKRHREEYYRRLNLVRLEGNWEGWIDFFLDGTISGEAVASARELVNLVSADRVRLLEAQPASVPQSDCSSNCRVIRS